MVHIHVKSFIVSHSRFIVRLLFSDYISVLFCVQQRVASTDGNVPASCVIK